MIWSRTAPAILLALASAIASPIRAGTINHGTEQAHLDFASDPIFESVGWVRGVDSTGSYVAGTGVLIHPEWVLTASHVLASRQWDSVQFSLDLRANDPNRTLHPAQAWFIHPDYEADPRSGFGTELSLIHLVNPITSVAPAKIYRGELSVGTHVNWAGYGRLRYPEGVEIPPSGTKRGGENIIDHIYERSSETYAGFYSYFLFDFGATVPTPDLPLEMGISGGANGGGVFISVGGETQLAGIVAFFFVPQDTVAIQPGLHLEWIESYVPLSEVPEPTSAALAVFTVAAIACPARSRRHDQNSFAA